MSGALSSPTSHPQHADAQPNRQPTSPASLHTHTHKRMYVSCNNRLTLYTAVSAPEIIVMKVSVLYFVGHVFILTHRHIIHQRGKLTLFLCTQTSQLIHKHPPRLRTRWKWSLTRDVPDDDSAPVALREFYFFSFPCFHAPD